MRNAEFKRKAKERLRGNWGQAIVVGLIFSIANGITSYQNNYSDLNNRHSSLGFTSMVLSLLVAPIMYGVIKYFMGFVREESVTIGDIFNSYKDFSKIVVATLLRNLFTFLWALLLIIPGIMKAYSYSMVYNVMNDNSELSGSDALKLSEKMMYGHRMELFILYMSIMGWAIVPMLILVGMFMLMLVGLILSSTTLLASLLVVAPVAIIAIIVLSVAILWLQPYYLVAKSYFYEEIRRDYMYR